MSAAVPPPARQNVLRGVWRLATGRADGFAQIGNTAQSFLTSLAPLQAFPLVLAALVAGEGRIGAALLRLFATVCLLLAPPVLSFAVARHWGREDRWPRFAAAFNWCQWAVPIVASALFLLVDLLAFAGVPPAAAGLLLPYGLAAYALWLHWFLMRYCLEIGPGRAIAGTLFVNVGTALVLVGPALLRILLGAPSTPA